MSEKVENALKAARETRACLVGEGVIAEVPNVFREQFGENWKKAIVIADPRTWKAAGETVAHSLNAEPFLIDEEDFHAEMKYVDRICAILASRPDCLPVAVGSGTINDLTKLASGRAGRPYMVVGTAASMDGYASYGASITYQNAKQTFPCPAPVAIVADLDVMRHAPAGMTASGYADLFSKVVAGADWILADAVGADPINPTAWSIVQDDLQDALGAPAGISAGDKESLRKFVEGLMLGGFAMQYLRSSRVASGAEHQFSHLWDMEHHTYKGHAPSHGFKVGVATHFIAGIYERLLDEPMEKFDIPAACAAWPTWPQVEAEARALYAGTGFEDFIVGETKAKYVDRAGLAGQLQKIKDRWPELKARLAKQLLTQKEVESRFRLVGAPVEPEEIGISRERMRASVLKAQYLRRRYNVLDLALRMGLLSRWTDSILSK